MDHDAGWRGFQCSCAEKAQQEPAEDGDDDHESNLLGEIVLSVRVCEGTDTFPDAESKSEGEIDAKHHRLAGSVKPKPIPCDPKAGREPRRPYLSHMSMMPRSV